MRTCSWGSSGMTPVRAMCLRLIEDNGALKRLDALAVTVPQLMYTVIMMAGKSTSSVMLI